MIEAWKCLGIIGRELPVNGVSGNLVVGSLEGLPSLSGQPQPHRAKHQPSRKDACMEMKGQQTYPQQWSPVFWSSVFVICCGYESI